MLTIMCVEIEAWVVQIGVVAKRRAGKLAHRPASMIRANVDLSRFPLMVARQGRATPQPIRRKGRPGPGSSVARLAANIPRSSDAG